MSTLFKKQDENLWALAGDSPGTSANWLETTGQDFANALARIHGNAAILAPSTWKLWKARYLEPLNAGVTAGTVEVDPDRIASATADELARRIQS